MGEKDKTRGKTMEAFSLYECIIWVMNEKFKTQSSNSNSHFQKLAGYKSKPNEQLPGTAWSVSRLNQHSLLLSRCEIDYGSRSHPRHIHFSTWITYCRNSRGKKVKRSPTWRTNDVNNITILRQPVGVCQVAYAVIANSVGSVTKGPSADVMHDIYHELYR